MPGKITHQYHYSNCASSFLFHGWIRNALSFSGVMQKWISYSFTPLSRENMASSKWIILSVVSSWGFIYKNSGNQACRQIKHPLFLFWNRFHTNLNTDLTLGLNMCVHLHTSMNSPPLLFSLFFILCNFKLSIINSALWYLPVKDEQGLECSLQPFSRTLPS